MPAGRPLRLNELAAELGVSTTPVRSALERLAFEGLVVMRGRKGASVAPLSLNGLHDVYTIRRALEGTAAKLAAPLLSDRDIAQMRGRIGFLEEIAHAGRPQMDLYLKSEWEMHRTCYAATGYPRLLEEIETYRRQAERYFRLAFTDGVNVLEDLENQRAFCDACCARDGEKAATMAEVLLDVTVTTVGPFLKGR
jgi:DNA-binding GntR family transcriptional regulator